MVSNAQALLNALRESIINLKLNDAPQLAQEAVDAGISPRQIIDALTRGMEIIGERFKRCEVFIPEVMVACDAFNAAMERIRPHLSVSDSEQFIATMVIGSIYGDVHTVGKDVATAVFRAAGFNVIDLGITVEDRLWVEAIREHEPELIGLGTYMTSTFMHTREVVRVISEAGLRNSIKIICGGPSVDPDAARKMGADDASSNAWEAVEKMKLLVEELRRERGDCQ